MIPTQKSDWMVHVNGIGNLVETSGPASFADGSLHTLFAGLRPMLVRDRRPEPRVTLC
jgi:hypothetical protein